MVRSRFTSLPFERKEQEYVYAESTLSVSGKYVIDQVLYRALTMSIYIISRWKNSNLAIIYY